MRRAPVRVEWRGFRALPVWAQLLLGAWVVFVVVLVLIGRTGGPRDGQPDDPVVLELSDEVPDRLADGSTPPVVPAAVGALVDGPVVAARVDADADFPGCREGVAWLAEPRVSPALVLPESIVVSLSGQGRTDAIRLLVVVCERAPDGRLIQRAVGTDELPGDGFGHATESGFEVYQDARVPNDWEWLLHDRGPYWLAVPVDRLDVVRLRWWGEPDDRISMGSSRVVFSDADGRRHARHWITGGGFQLGDSW